MFTWWILAIVHWNEKDTCMIQFCLTQFSHSQFSIHDNGSYVSVYTHRQIYIYIYLYLCVHTYIYISVLFFDWAVLDAVLDLNTSVTFDAVIVTWMVGSYQHICMCNMVNLRVCSLSASLSIIETSSDRVQDLSQHHWQYCGNNNQCYQVHCWIHDSRRVPLHCTGLQCFGGWKGN